MGMDAPSSAKSGTTTPASPGIAFSEDGVNSGALDKTVVMA
jgi:hypothetical protein